MQMQIEKLIFTVAAIFAGLWLTHVEPKYIEYNTTSEIVPDKINVHLVPHSHDDVGWLKTVDQYFVGANNSIRVRNGGMCMHDEAATHYIDLIDQTTLGHRFIEHEFGQKPRVGWQIDPFGHSAVQAYLLGAELGFDSLFFARIDYQDRAKRKDKKALEVIWRGSRSLSSSSQDDDLLFDYNVEQRVNDFVAAALQQAARQLEFFKGRNSSGPSTDALADALAIAQHHDAVSGTERQHVASDYALRLSIGYREAEKVVASSLALLTGLRLNATYEDSVPEFQQCPLLNISYCPPSEANLTDEKSLIIIAYNPLGWKRKEIIRIPVSSECLIVLDSTGKEIESQLLPLSNVSLRTRHYHVKVNLGRSASSLARYWLAFSATVPPLGFSTYVVSSAKRTESSSVISTQFTPEESIDNTFEVGQGNLKLLYTVDEGKLTRYINNRNSVSYFAEALI
ncbi:Glycosyl hydrolase family 38 protein [Forsythia ovata]|uniref:Glycosyl hydrolase family 38 protein n=1 Tax=Forsythia ovata TaxID=205694 RepID=A0ABD1NWB1_9LAMI